jgi:coenzyme PQQ biosynthesis protein PqqD
MEAELKNRIPELQTGILLQPVTASTGETREMVVVLPNRNQVKVVNEVGALILELIDGKRCVAEIINTVHESYQVSPEQVEQDVINFLNQLVEKGIVSFSNGA